MGNGLKDRGWTHTFVVSSDIASNGERQEHQQVSPSVTGWNNRDKTRAASVEPATGQRAARATWKRRHDN